MKTHCKVGFSDTIKPMKIILLRGLAASGKSTLAKKLIDSIEGSSLWSKDTLFDVCLENDLEVGLSNKITYTYLYENIRYNAKSNSTLLIDGTFSREHDIQNVKDCCSENDIELKTILVTCSDETEWRRRFDERAKNPLPNQTITDYDEMEKYYGSMQVEALEGEYVYDSCGDIDVQVQMILKYLE